MNSYPPRPGPHRRNRPPAPGGRGQRNFSGPPRAVSVQDPFLNVLRKERVPADIYLLNGVKLVRCIQSFDQQVVVLSPPEDEEGRMTEMVYKHALSTITPHTPMLRGPMGMTTREDQANAPRDESWSGASEEEDGDWEEGEGEEDWEGRD